MENNLKPNMDSANVSQLKNYADKLLTVSYAVFLIFIIGAISFIIMTFSQSAYYIIFALLSLLCGYIGYTLILAKAFYYKVIADIAENKKD